MVACAQGGRIVICGATAGYEPMLNLRHVFWRQLSVLGSTMASKARLFDASGPVRGRAAEAGRRPGAARWPRLRQRTKLLESRAIFGKLVLTPSQQICKTLPARKG